LSSLWSEYFNILMWK